MEEKRLDFFSDIKDKLLLIIIGLASVYTIIPIFFNQLNTIFHLENSFAWAYGIFTFLYFLFPLVFYLVYCSIHDYVGFLELLSEKYFEKIKKRNKLLIEISCVLVVFCYLLYPCMLLSWAGFTAMNALAVFVFISYVLKYRNVNFLKGDYKEFCILGSIILSIFTVFFFSNFGYIRKNFESETWETRQQTFKNYGFKDSIQNITDTTVKWKEHFYKGSLEALSQNPSAPLTPMNIDSSYLEDFKRAYLILKNFDNSALSNMDFCVARDIGDVFASTDRKLKITTRYDTSLIYRTYESSYYLNDYAKKIKSKKERAIARLWKDCIVNLQFKGLAWLLLLIILSLCLWLHMQEKFKRLNLLYGQTKYMDEGIKEQLVIINDNINQARTFVYIAVLLVIPFFRRIDAGDIALDKPFLSNQLVELVSNKDKTPEGSATVNLEEVKEKLISLQQNLKSLSDDEGRRHQSTMKNLNSVKDEVVKETQAQWKE